MGKRNKREVGRECKGPLRKKNTIVIASLMGVVFITGGFVVAANGYIPINGLVEDIPCPPDSTEITVDQLLEFYSPYAQHLIDGMPHKNDIIIRWFETNLTSYKALEFFSDWLSSKGYSYVKGGCYFMNNEMNSVDTAYHQGWICVDYYGYLKGLTAAGIIVFTGVEGKTLVLFTTGYAGYYKNIMWWFNTLN